jgi:hypothetical protein
MQLQYCLWANDCLRQSDKSFSKAKDGINASNVHAISLVHEVVLDKYFHSKNGKGQSHPQCYELSFTVTRGLKTCAHNSKT